MIERGEVIEASEFGTRGIVRSIDRPGIMTTWFTVLNGIVAKGDTVAFVIFENGTGFIICRV